MFFFYRWTLFLLVQWWVRRRLYSGAWKNCRTPPETMMFRNHGDGFHCHFWLPEGNTLQWHVIQPYIYSYLYYITLIHIIYIYIYAHMYTHTQGTQMTPILDAQILPDGLKPSDLMLWGSAGHFSRTALSQAYGSLIPVSIPRNLVASDARWPI